MHFKVVLVILLRLCILDFLLVSTAKSLCE